MARIAGIKIWWADGSKSVIRMDGRNQQQVGQDLAALPSSGFEIGMIYYQEFSVDGKTRYRRILQGNAIYYITFDSTAPPQFRDWLFGQTNTASDLDRYPGAKSIVGQTTNDDFYKVVTTQAMGDMNMSEFGLAPKPGTTDI